jgi:hypothetical protein
MQPCWWFSLERTLLRDDTDRDYLGDWLFEQWGSLKYVVAPRYDYGYYQIGRVARLLDKVIPYHGISDTT